MALAPERYRHLLARRFGEGETLPQIAGTLGVSPSAVGRQIADALGHIRAATA